jgi:hypothetical protein
VEKSKRIIALKSILFASVATTAMLFAISLGDSVEINVRPGSIQVKVDTNGCRCLMDTLPPTKNVKG